jgi:hypothetical protein
MENTFKDKGGNGMKTLLMTLMMLVLSSAVFAAEIDGRWVGTQGGMTLTFEFRVEDKNLYGLYLGSGAGDEKKEILDGKVKKDKISFEVPITQGVSKQVLLYKGKIISDSEIQLTTRFKSRGPRQPGFGEGGGGGFSSVGGDMGGFGGASQESPPFIIKRVE